MNITLTAFGNTGRLVHMEELQLPNEQLAEYKSMPDERMEDMYIVNLVRYMMKTPVQAQDEDGTVFEDPRYLPLTHPSAAYVTAAWSEFKYPFFEARRRVLVRRVQ